MVGLQQYNVVCSDHFPLCIEVKCDIIPLYNSTTTTAVNSSIQWHAAKDSDKLQCMIKSEKLASKIVLPVDALMCKNTHCTDL